MDRIRRLLPLIAFAAPAALASRRAAACDPDAMDAHLTAVCEGGLAPARLALAAALPHATPDEAAALRRVLALATDACTSGDPVAGARFAANLARMAGRIEGRSGGDPLDLAATG